MSSVLHVVAYNNTEGRAPLTCAANCQQKFIDLRDQDILRVSRLNLTSLRFHTFATHFPENP